MFDDRLSFPTTSEQAGQLQAESDAEGRSVAFLVREAIDQFLPRLRDRRRKRRRQPPGGPSAARARMGRGFEPKARQLLGDPQARTAREWRYGSLKINLETGLWSDSETNTGGSFLDLIQRKLQTDQRGALDWLTREGLLPGETARRMPQNPQTGPAPAFWPFKNDRGASTRA